jgi:hypothetical protein
LNKAFFWWFWGLLFGVAPTATSEEAVYVSDSNNRPGAGSSNAHTTSSEGEDEFDEFGGDVGGDW